MSFRGTLNEILNVLFVQYDVFFSWNIMLSSVGPYLHRSLGLKPAEFMPLALFRQDNCRPPLPMYMYAKRTGEKGKN